MMMYQQPTSPRTTAGFNCATPSSPSRPAFQSSMTMRYPIRPSAAPPTEAPPSIPLPLPPASPSSKMALPPPRPINNAPPPSSYDNNSAKAEPFKLPPLALPLPLPPGGLTSPTTITSPSSASSVPLTPTTPTSSESRPSGRRLPTSPATMRPSRPLPKTPPLETAPTSTSPPKPTTLLSASLNIPLPQPPPQSPPHSPKSIQFADEPKVVDVAPQSPVIMGKSASQRQPRHRPPARPLPAPTAGTNHNNSAASDEENPAISPRSPAVSPPGSYVAQLSPRSAPSTPISPMPLPPWAATALQNVKTNGGTTILSPKPPVARPGHNRSRSTSSNPSASMLSSSMTASGNLNRTRNNTSAQFVGTDPREAAEREREEQLRLRRGTYLKRDDEEVCSDEEFESTNDPRVHAYSAYAAMPARVAPCPPIGLSGELSWITLVERLSSGPTMHNQVVVQSDSADASPGNNEIAEQQRLKFEQFLARTRASNRSNSNRGPSPSLIGSGDGKQLKKSVSSILRSPTISKN